MKMKKFRSPGVWGEPRTARQLSPVCLSVLRLQYGGSDQPGCQRPQGPTGDAADYADDQCSGQLNILATQDFADDAGDGDGYDNDQRLYGGAAIVLYLLVGVLHPAGRCPASFRELNCLWVL